MDKNLDELKNMVVDVWTHGLFGVDIGSIIIALGILLSFLLIRGMARNVNAASFVADCLGERPRPPSPDCPPGDH